MTPATLKRKWDRLSFWRKEWVRAKCEWEHMTVSAVLHEYKVPPTRACKKMLGPKEES